MMAFVLQLRAEGTSIIAVDIQTQGAAPLEMQVGGERGSTGGGWTCLGPSARAALPCLLMLR